jgi:hypothetical protein
MRQTTQAGLISVGVHEAVISEEMGESALQNDYAPGGKPRSNIWSFGISDDSLEGAEGTGTTGEMSPHSIYPSRILSGRQIRLLFICPSSDPHRRLECHLQSFELEQAPDYEALSYVWGDPDPTMEIICNGQSVTVRLNLGNALARLRLSNSRRIIWADALCINQIDNEEKSHQVPLMGMIYSQAKTVVVWLGPGDVGETKEAAQIVEFIANAVRQHRERNSHLSDIEVYEALLLPADPFTPAVCFSLQEFCGRPWFSRIWCVQEISSAQEALVLWGQQELSWEDVGLAVSWVFWKLCMSDKSDPVTSLLTNISAGNGNIMYGVKARVWPLFDLLSQHHNFRATNPRDKVYGLLSLARSLDADALELDYDKSVGEVYADTVLSQIRLHSQLTAFAYVAHPEEYHVNNEFTSWTPRWDRSDSPSSIGDYGLSCPWSVCGGYYVKMVDVHHVGPEQLRLFGILYDIVTSVQVVMNTGNLYNLDEPSERHPLLCAYDDIIASSSLIPYDGSEERWNTLARTLTAGLAYDAKYFQNLDEAAQKVRYKACARVFERLYMLDAPGADDVASDDSSTLEYQTQVYQICNERRIFRTKNGSCGLGPQCMRTGDIVVVLYGGETPYVLRPHGDKYLLMGETYIDGIMNGQIIDEMEAGRLQEQEFCLV